MKFNRTNPGEFRVPATYERPVVANDSVGQPIQTWEPVFSGLIAVRPLSARELYYAQSTRSETTHRIACRYRPEVKSEGRFRLASGRVFNLASVLNLEERNAELVCTAIEAT